MGTDESNYQYESGKTLLPSKKGPEIKIERKSFKLQDR